MTKRALLVVLSFAAAFAFVHVAGACLDVTPIVVDNDAFDPDSSCLRCLELPQGCADLVASCEEDPRCKTTFACIVAVGCFDLRTIDDKEKCGLGCAQEAGVQSLDDPTATYLIDFVSCGKQKCAGSCNLVDANIGF